MWNVKGKNDGLDKLINMHPEFDQLTEQDKLTFLMTTDDRQTLAWLG